MRRRRRWRWRMIMLFKRITKVWRGRWKKLMNRRKLCLSLILEVLETGGDKYAVRRKKWRRRTGKKHSVIH
jgi:hypothetical protein